MPQWTTAPSTQTLLQLVDGPAMLSQLVRIGRYIVDALVLDAHPDVATWYGYDNPEDLRGRYVSHLHDARDLAQIRLYAVARQLGLQGIPKVYDIRINLPDGTQRWMRKQQVRQITDGDDVYWVSYSHPVAASEAQPMPVLSIPLSGVALERYVGRYSVADTERLIEHASPLPHLAARGATCPEETPQHSDPVDLVTLLQSATSLELPLGSATYRRWIHCCNRCHQHWVAESATPKRCNHCHSPYWNVPRTRNTLEQRGARDATPMTDPCHRQAG